jgi:O-antigen ligase
VVIDTIIFAAVAAGVRIPIEIIRYRIDGFAQNANAFALQLLFATAVILSRRMEARAQIAALAVAFLGLWLTGSKAGLVALAAALVAAIVLGAARIVRIGAAIVLAAIIVLVINWLPDILFAVTQASNAVTQAVTGLFCGSCSDAAPATALAKLDFSALSVAASGYEASSAERAASLRAGWQMFLSHPIAGAGLGAFLEQHQRIAGAPLVIHSTPLWLLAETGAIGFLVFAAPFIRIFSRAIAAARQHQRAAQMLVLVMIGFGTMAIVHELLYQRAFWLLLGAALALPRHEPQR